MALLIEEDEIRDGWQTLVRKIMTEGKEIRDERGSLTKELLNIMVSIKKPLRKKFIRILLNQHGPVKKYQSPGGIFLEWGEAGNIFPAIPQ